MMEVLGGALAAIQLLECLAKSLIQAKKAYHKIKTIDEERRDMETIMDITALQISNLEQCINMSPPDSPIRHSFKLTRTLKACDLAFSELAAISKKIWDDRKTFRSFRWYCRQESYKEQIHKLRSIIKKCIQALELPTLFGKIDHCHRDTGRGMERVEDRLEELAECIKSMQQAQQLHRLTPSPQPEAPLSLERMVVQVKQDVKVLFDQQNSDSRLPRASAAVFSQVFSALETIHREVSKMTGTFTDLTHSNLEDSETELKVRNVGDEAELAIKELNASIISAASKLGSVLTTPPAQDSNPSTEKDLPPKKSVDGAIDEFRGFNSIGSRREENNRKVMGWNEGSSTDDTQSIPGSTTQFGDGSTSATLEHGRTSPTSDATSALGCIDVYDVDQEQVDIVEKMMAEAKYHDAVQYLKDTFEREKKRRKCLPQPLLQHFAKAISDAELCGIEAERACEVAPDVGPLLDAARLEKAKTLLDCGEFRRINLLLEPYGEVSAREQQYGFQLDSVQMELRLIRCLTLVRFGASTTALDILRMLLRSKELSEAQRGYANYYAAEALFLQASLDINLFEENLKMAKKLCSKAYNLMKRPSEIVSKGLISCISLMVEICLGISYESEVESWKARLAKVQRKCIDSHPGSLQPKPCAFPSDATQRFSEILNQMLEQGKKDIETAADMVIRYLEQNYEVDALCPKWYDTARVGPPLICFGCIRNSIVELIKHGSIIPSPSINDVLCNRHQKTENWQEFHGFDKPPEALLGPRHMSDSCRKSEKAGRFVTCFNLLSFLAIADPISSRPPANCVSGCVGEIKALFQFASLDREGIRKVVNAAISIPVPEDSTSSDKAMNILRTPVWLAACFGQKQVVKYFLSLGVVNDSQFSYEGLLQYPPCYPQGTDITAKINDSLVALVDTVAESQAAHLLSVAPALWSWDRLPVFDALLSKAGSKSLNSQLIMKIPYFEETKWVVRSVDMHLVHCLVQFWINTPIQPGRVLSILKRHEANFRVKYQGRTAIDVARSLAQKHFQRHDPPAGRLIKMKPPSLTAGNAQWHRRTLQHIKTVQYLLYADSDDFTDVSDDFQAEIQGTVSRLNATLDVDVEDDAHSEKSHELTDVYMDT